MYIIRGIFMSVDEQSPRCDTYYSDREMIRAVRGGTETLQAAREKYLPRESAESKDRYERRLARLFLRRCSIQHSCELHSERLRSVYFGPEVNGHKRPFPAKSGH